MDLYPPAIRHLNQLLWLTIGIMLHPGVAFGHLHDVIRDLQVSAGGTIFAVSRLEALRSTDGGLTWQRLRIRIDSSEFKGLDRYTSWFNLSPNFDEDGTMFGFQHTRRSTDGGLNWAPVTADFSPCKDEGALAFSPHFVDDRVVVLAGRKEGSYGVYRSTDKGVNFEKLKLPEDVKLNSCPTLLTSKKLLFLATRAGDLIASDDAGQSWNLVLRANGLNIKKLVSDVLLDHLLLVTTKKIFRLSLQNNVRWPLGNADLTELALPKQGESLDIGVVASHTGPIGENSLFVMRTSCPTVRKCKDTGKDVVLISHNAGHSWNEQKIVDWWCKDRNNQNASHFKDQEFTHIEGIPGTRRLYMGTWSGIYISEDGGDSWTELDTIARTVTGMTVVEGSRKDHIYLEACTYSDGCFGGEIDLAQQRLGSSGHVIKKFKNSSVGRYRIVKRSPSFGKDRVALRSYFQFRRAPFLERSVDGFETIQAIEMQTFLAEGASLNQPGKNSVKAKVNTIHFSPTFSTDGTVFAGGSYIGLSMSTDFGKSFHMVWDADRGSIAKLSLSPEFSTDGTMIAVVDYKPNDRPTKGMKTRIFLSEDRGLSWKALHSETKSWYSAVVTAGPNSQEGTTVVALSSQGRLFVNSAPGGGFLPLRNVEYSNRPLGIGHGGLVVGPGGELAAAYYEGSLVMGLVNKGARSLIRTRYSQPDVMHDNTEAGQWMFTGHPNLFTKRTKLFNDFLVFSPNYTNDRTLFGSSYYSIYASFNNGVTWQRMYEIPFREPRQCDGVLE